MEENESDAPSRVLMAAERALQEDLGVGLTRDPRIDRGPALDRPHRTEGEFMGTQALRSIFPGFGEHKAAVVQRMLIARRTHPSAVRRDAS